MKKKAYKQIMKRLNRETKKRIKAEERAETADFYAERFRKLGTNVETVEPDSGKLVVCEKWEIEPQLYGTYAVCDTEFMNMERVKKEVIQSIAEILFKRNLLQFIVKRANESDPLARFWTVGAKLYIVPWEQMPHKRTVELRKYVENTLREEDVR